VKTTESERHRVSLEPGNRKIKHQYRDGMPVALLCISCGLIEVFSERSDEIDAGKSSDDDDALSAGFCVNRSRF
jgi:hypothetical protein